MPEPAPPLQPIAPAAGNESDDAPRAKPTEQPTTHDTTTELDSDSSKPPQSADALNSQSPADAIQSVEDRLPETGDRPQAEPLPSAAYSPDSLTQADDTNDPSLPGEEAGQDQLRGGQPMASGPPKVSSTRRLISGQRLPAVYEMRVADERMEILLRRGGNADTEAAVQRALLWLVDSQNGDGRWDSRQTGGGRETQTMGHDRGNAGIAADTGITGLALLAFLGSGETHLDGPHRSTVQKGLEFLIASQRHDGEMAGAARPYARMYCHGMATLAVCEAYAMTGDHRLEPFVQRAIHYTLASQDRRSGGWRYGPQQTGDTSQFGWQVMAVKSAEHAGRATPPSANSGMRAFLDSVSSGQHDGLAAYQVNSRPSRSMTAEALVCRLLLEQRPDPGTLAEAAEYIVQSPPGPDRVNYYYWYYATLGLSRVGGETWDYWNRAMQHALLSMQRSDQPLSGSWDPNSIWGGYGGRVYSTALAAMCLEVYYRYQPTYNK
jgi:hypothetical protein